MNKNLRTQLLEAALKATPPPPPIARLALLNILPDLITRVIKNHQAMVEASVRVKNTAEVAATSLSDLKTLLTWLDDIGCDKNYLALMDKQLQDGLNTMPKEDTLNGSDDCGLIQTRADLR